MFGIEIIFDMEWGGGGAKQEYQFTRSGGNHDIYYNPETKYSISLKRGHSDEDDLIAIIIL